MYLRDAQYAFRKGTHHCGICMRTKETSLESYYHCVECELNFHFECLEISKSLVKKSYHIHPLVCKRFLCKDESLEYCGVCETMVHAGHYSCEICDFIGHTECILREEEPSPLYLKDLYLYGEGSTRTTNGEDHGSNEMETELMVNDVVHIHVMKPSHLSELDKRAKCNLCKIKISGSPYKCTTCSFQTHHFCAELGQPSVTRLLHQNHPLTLLSKTPTGLTTHCDSCKESIYEGFNLFCRICDFIIDISCALKGKRSLGMVGIKVIGEGNEFCLSGEHRVVQVILSKSCLSSCAICSEKVYGKGLSCMTCEEMYHSQCHEVWKKPLFDHPFHSNHLLVIRLTSGAECIACKMNIAKHGYNCGFCKISFHIECIKAVDKSRKIRLHSHYFYNFWVDDLRLNQACNVCACPCGASFYGCVDCNFNAHVKCVGIAESVKSQRHRHSVVEKYIFNDKSYSQCGSDCNGYSYSCNHCDDVFHIRCLMPLKDREPATEEDQLCDIYLIYIERELLDILED